MNLLISFPLAQAANHAAGSSWSMWVMLALIFVVMWFFMIRPQRKQQKELQNFRNALKKGDKVVTVGGIHGVISSTKEKTVIVKVDDNAKIEFSRNAITSVIVDKAEKDSKAAKDDKKADKVEEAAATETEASTEENK